ncbi:uncharacterized protein LOC126937254 [Macaca thibetana thibetana]|uniref:uncharacterized protein LOC126937254 n=1 Tax=Macaca thibetana thibetana TaxID=257877 RepID=UPI0021BC91B7|nr:uncharacterized protein LOC126937254 [Macaca thibetana thibetana]
MEPPRDHATSILLGSGHGPGASSEDAVGSGWDSTPTQRPSFSGFRGFGLDLSSGFRGFGLDLSSGFRGFGLDLSSGFRGFGLDLSSGFRGFGLDLSSGFRGFGLDLSSGFRGFGLDLSSGFRGFGLDLSSGFRGFGLDLSSGFRGFGLDLSSGFCGSRLDLSSGFRGFGLDLSSGFRGFGLDLSSGFRRFGLDLSSGFHGFGLDLVGGSGAGLPLSVVFDCSCSGPGCVLMWSFLWAGLDCSVSGAMWPLVSPLYSQPWGHGSWEAWGFSCPHTRCPSSPSCRCVTPSGPLGVVGLCAQPGLQCGEQLSWGRLGHGSAVGKRSLTLPVVRGGEHLSPVWLPQGQDTQPEGAMLGRFGGELDAGSKRQPSRQLGEECGAARCAQRLGAPGTRSLHHLQGLRAWAPRAACWRGLFIQGPHLIVSADPRS